MNELYKVGPAPGCPAERAAAVPLKRKEMGYFPGISFF
jgi:hypothetical protein